MYLGSFLGGLLIGGAALVLLGASGRILGVSGIVGGLWGARPLDVMWRLLFVFGLWCGVGLYQIFQPGVGAFQVAASVPVLFCAGLLVGYGTRLGNGCTSGHGICGVGRLSPRSLVATLLFILFGMGVVFVLRHV